MQRHLQQNITVKVTSTSKIYCRKVALDVQLTVFLFEEKTMFRFRDI